MRKPYQHQFLRQLAFYDPDFYDPCVTVVGAGGIGSPVVWLLAKLGLRRITVIDGDRVELHNLPTTMYSKTTLGLHKVLALRKTVKRGTGVTIRAVVGKFRGGKLPKTDILISAVDSMDARRMLFRAARLQKIPFFVDGRIGGEKLRVYSIYMKDVHDRRLYKSTLVPNSRVSPLPCTAQQVPDVGYMVSSMIVRAVRCWVATGRWIPEIVYYQDQVELAQVAEQKSLYNDQEEDIAKMLGLLSSNLPEVPLVVEGGIDSKHPDPRAEPSAIMEGS